MLRIQSEENVRKVIDLRMPKIKNKMETQCLQDYEFQIRLRENTTEDALFQQFDKSLHAYKPLASPDRLMSKDITFPISIIYGDSDFMDARGSR